MDVFSTFLEGPYGGDFEPGSTCTDGLCEDANFTIFKQVDASSLVPQDRVPHLDANLGRVASVTCTGGVGWGQGFTYDAYGNITKSGSLAFNPGYNNTGMNNQVDNFSYDGMGNVTNDKSYNYTYDAESRPTNISGIQITLDAFGRAVEQSNSGTYSEMVYSPSGQKFALMHGQSVQWYFVPLAAGATAVYNATDLQYYRHADWLGSSWLAVNTNGTVYGDQGYAPFGEGYAGSGSALGVFTGQTKDTVGGDYDFLFRQYAPAEGRWLVPDPAGLTAVDITNPQTWNRYAYLSNNPLNATDPDGLYRCADPFDYTANCDGDASYGGGGGGGGGGGSGGGIGPDPTYIGNMQLCSPGGVSFSSGVGGPSMSCGDFTWYLPVLESIPGFTGTTPASTPPSSPTPAPCGGSPIGNSFGSTSVANPCLTAVALPKSSGSGNACYCSGSGGDPNFLGVCTYSCKCGTDIADPEYFTLRNLKRDCGWSKTSCPRRLEGYLNDRPFFGDPIGTIKVQSCYDIQ